MDKSSQINTRIRNEMIDWFVYNNNDDIQIYNQKKNIISINYNGTIHLIEIKNDNTYPVKKSYTVSDLSEYNKFDFIKKINSQVQNKTDISLKNILDHIRKTYNKFVEKNSKFNKKIIIDDWILQALSDKENNEYIIKLNDFKTVHTNTSDAVQDMLIDTEQDNLSYVENKVKILEKLLNDTQDAYCERGDIIKHLTDDIRELKISSDKTIIELKNNIYKLETEQKNTNIINKLNDTLDAYNERGDIIKHLTDDIRELKISSNKTIIELKNNIYNLVTEHNEKYAEYNKIRDDIYMYNSILTERDDRIKQLMSLLEKNTKDMI